MAKKKDIQETPDPENPAVLARIEELAAEKVAAGPEDPSALARYEELIAEKVAAGLHPVIAAEAAKRQLDRDAENAAENDAKEAESRC